ncbi:hypothetical protein [Sediminibacterium soli]|uniref:hypothetical protein n=1 Tax=Sediminibacterium soli TaxID=2698829 RepID=UPI001379B73D|nr:hypothetical protein [Sediminibacterium soli]NCI45881.1 hypothetical protein [Sediminibacterium soli]
MNNPVIKTYDDLLLEKRRLKSQLTEKEAALREEFSDIKRKLKPVTKVMDFIEKLTTRDSSNPLLNTGLQVGVNLLLKNLLLKKAGWVTRILMPFFVKNFLSHEASEHPEWMQKLARLFRKTFRKKTAEDE